MNTTTTRATKELRVAGIDWDAVTLAVIEDEGKERKVRLSWRDLRASAAQDDPDLRAAYAEALAEAEALARSRKAIRVEVHNMSGHDSDLGALTWAATLHRMGGEFTSGRLIAADWGLTGRRDYAQMDAERSREKLAAMGYEVR